MFRQIFRRELVVSAVVLGLLSAAVPAFGQPMGSVRGLVTDEAGLGVPGAEILLTFIGGFDLTANVTANDKGEFSKAGLRTGQWNMVATKDDLTGTQNIRVVINTMTRAATLIIMAPVAGAGEAEGMTDEEVDERNALMASMQVEFEAGVAAIDTAPDEAIAKFIAVLAVVEDCAVCYSRIGDANMKKPDLAAAETAYKKAIELQEDLSDPYAGLAILYNQQKKFDEATAMSQKANDLLGSSAGGGDPAALYNQAIILWNAGKYPEAKAEFQKVIALDATMAEAHFRLGMANLNLGQLPDAAASFEEYLKIAPEGENAEMAKSILKQIK